MSASAIDPVRETLGRLRDDFTAKGYRFITDPPSEQLPPFLGTNRPDALAIGQDGNDKVVIEIRPQASHGARVAPYRFDRDAAARDGWRYLLVYVGQDLSEIVALSRPKKSQVDRAIDEVRKLERSGYSRAAMLEGWSLLEALARRIYPDDIRVSLKPPSPMQVVERLAMDGQIDNEDARRLRTLSSIRNAMSHGDLDVTVSADDLRYLLDKVEAVNARVTP